MIAQEQPLQGPGPRVLHVFGALEVGGAETWVSAALNRGGLEAASRHDFCLLSDGEGPLAFDLRSRRHRVLHVPRTPAWSFPLRFFRFLRTSRYEVVHAHVLFFSGVVVSVARAARVPVRIAHAHNDADGRGGSPLRRLYRLSMRRLIAWSATCVAGCTARAASALSSRGAASKILPYGVDLTPARHPQGASPRSAVLESLKIPRGARIWGHLGRLAPQKNQRFLLEAFTAACVSDAGVFLLIAGEGALRAQLEAYAQGLGVAERVRFLGLRRDARTLLSDVFDVLLLPSLHEGLPVVLLEAQAAGLPCLISDEVNPESVVLHEQVRSLPLSAGFAAWSAAAGALTRQPRTHSLEAAERLRQAGFDVSQSWKRLLELYRSESPKPGKPGTAPIPPPLGVAR